MINKDSIKNYMSRYGTKHDPTTHAKPSGDQRLSRDDLETAFLQVDLARRIITEIVYDSLRSGLPPLQYMDTGEEVKLDFFTSQRVQKDIKDGCVDARLFGGAHLVCITDETENLAQPIDWSDPPQLVNAFPVNRYEATVQEWQTDPRQRGYRDPLYYAVHPDNPAGDYNHYPRVHTSRMISFRGNRLPRTLRRRNEDYDDAVLQNCWYNISNFIQAEQSLVNIISRFETATMKIDGLSEVQSDEEGGDLLEGRMDLVARSLQMLNMVLIDADGNEEFKREFAQVSGLELLIDRLMLSVAKAVRYPMTHLFGEAASGIRGDDETGSKSWRTQVEEFQVSQLLVPVCRYISLLKGERVSPILKSDGRPQWGLAESPRPIDRARMEQKKTEWITKAISAGLINRVEARRLMSDKDIDWDAPPPEVLDTEDSEEEELEA